MDSCPSYVAFAGIRRIAEGPLRDVLPVLKQRFDEKRSDLVLVFEVESGRQVDFDLRGALPDILEREAPERPRGPGRPKLGIVSREVSLLPRHWDWLNQQSTGVSGALRRVVEQATKSDVAGQRAEQVRRALSNFLSSMAGDRPNYEEACRALFAGDTARFALLIERWPKDIRAYAIERAREAAGGHARAASMTGDASAASQRDASVAGGKPVLDLIDLVWSRGNYRAIERLVAERYVVYSDPGDPWEGQTLDRKDYEKRVRYSRTAFPDLVFSVHDHVASAERVALRWTAHGTHTGDLAGLTATGRQVSFAGQTFYQLADGRVAGHWQVIDRLGLLSQVR